MHLSFLIVTPFRLRTIQFELHCAGSSVPVSIMVCRMYNVQNVCRNFMVGVTCGDPRISFIPRSHQISFFAVEIHTHFTHCDLNVIYASHSIYWRAHLLLPHVCCICSFFFLLVFGCIRVPDFYFSFTICIWVASNCASESMCFGQRVDSCAHHNSYAVCNTP